MSTMQQKPQSQQSRSPSVAPVAILSPCSHSHPFDERRIQVLKSEENAVKIGRSVVRLQPTPNNAIFDCKVLSRNHAIMWVGDEGQRFFIKDTKSSNGTFINNERLSASGEESGPRELFTGDILQLGVEIVDNTKKVASGCVTCIVRLINEKGEECPGRSSSSGGAEHFPGGLRSVNDSQIPLTKYTLIRNDKLFMMDQYVKEAKFRENLLGQKLQQLEEQLETAQEALQNSWQTLINEEQLLSRIELLESQLVVFANKQHPGNEEKLRNEIHEIHEDRAKAESVAKDSLRQAEEQVFETSMRLHDAENGLMNQEEECGFLRQKCQEFEQELLRQRDEYDQLLGRYSDTLAQLNASERTIAQLSQPNGQERALNNSGNNSLSKDDSGSGGLTTSPGGTEFRILPVSENIWQTRESTGFDPSSPINRSFISSNFNEQQFLETLSTLMQNSSGREDLIENIKQTVRVGLEDEYERKWIEVPAEPSIDNGKRVKNCVGWSSNEGPEEVCQLCSPDSPRHLTRNSDFQVCLLSMLPFILLIYLVLFPLSYLRMPTNWYWTSAQEKSSLDAKSSDSKSKQYPDGCQAKD